MGMYIIGKEPDRCGVCPCFHAENPMYCQAVKAAVQKPRIVRPYAKGRPEWCPLIYVPEPHGRLIDADKFKDYIMYGYESNKDLFVTEKYRLEAEKVSIAFCKDIDEQETIIPAEEG